MAKQTKQAVVEADVVIFLVDARLAWQFKTCHFEKPTVAIR
jgi:hypothetical protein